MEKAGSLRVSCGAARGYVELQETSQIAGVLQEYYAEDYEIQRSVVEDNKDEGITDGYIFSQC